MVDNFKKIIELLRFDRDGDFYFIEIIKRRKDNPRMKVDCKHIREYYIYSVEELNDLRDEILTYCELSRSRAYIRLNVRNSRDTLLHAMRLLTEAIGGDQKMTGTLCRRASSDKHSDPNQKFVVDVDSEQDLVFAKSVIKDLFSKRPEQEGRIIAEIKTPHGTHIISSPFEIEKFKQECPNIEVHRDGGTILYSPIVNPQDV